MMALGIVGHAAEKFACFNPDGTLDVRATRESEERARAAIRGLIERHDPQWVISGRSPMGGVDVWAIEEARRLQVKTFEFAPRVHTWSGPGGYKERNLQIARKCDHVAVVVLREPLPNWRGGVIFPVCYHCDGKPDDPGPHVKSGGCFTARAARSREWAIL